MTIWSSLIFRATNRRWSCCVGVKDAYYMSESLYCLYGLHRPLWTCMGQRGVRLLVRVLPERQVKEACRLGERCHQASCDENNFVISHQIYDIVFFFARSFQDVSCMIWPHCVRSYWPLVPSGCPPAPCPYRRSRRILYRDLCLCLLLRIRLARRMRRRQKRGQ